MVNALIRSDEDVLIRSKYRAIIFSQEVQKYNKVASYLVIKRNYCIRGITNKSIL